MNRYIGLRSPLALGIAAVLAVGTTAAGAATLHRLYDEYNATGSGGAYAFVASLPTSSALVGEVASSPNAKIKIPFGVLGEYDASSTTFGIGVAGVSTSGYGLAAESLNSANPTIIAQSMGSGDGLDAIVSSTAPYMGPSRTALYASNAGTGNAVEAVALGNNAVEASASDGGTASVVASSSAKAGYGVFVSTTAQGAEGVHVESQSGVGLFASSMSGTAGLPVMLLEAYKSPTDVLSVFTLKNNAEYLPLHVEYPSRNASGTVADPSGGSDLFVSGDMYIEGIAYGACSQFTISKCGTSEYGGFAAPRDEATSSQMVDLGEATLVRGRAHVPLDARFAAMISTTRPYLVFVSPTGESKGLYVENKTAKGFDVRENHGGRASIVVDYRIVALPRANRSAGSSSAGHTRKFPNSELAHVRARDAADEAYREAMAARMPHAPTPSLIETR